MYYNSIFIVNSFIKGNAQAPCGTWAKGSLLNRRGCRNGWSPFYSGTPSKRHFRRM